MKIQFIIKTHKFLVRLRCVLYIIRFIHNKIFISKLLFALKDSFKEIFRTNIERKKNIVQGEDRTHVLTLAGYTLLPTELLDTVSSNIIGRFSLLSQFSAELFISISDLNSRILLHLLIFQLNF